MKLSIIIPIFNEEKTIARVLDRVLSQEIGDWEKEVIVIDDHSTDSTQQRLEPFWDRIRIFMHPKNRGKGASLRTGFEAAQGNAIIVQDADLEYDPADWKRLLQELEENPNLAAVYGSRELNPERRGYFLYVWGVRFLSFLVNLLFGSNLTDVYTCYKLLRASVVRSIKLESSGFEIEAELTCKILKQGGRIKELPIRYFPRSFKEGKKIRAKDGLKGVFTIIKYRFFD